MKKVIIFVIVLMTFLFRINIKAETYKLSYDESGYFYSRIDDLNNTYKGTIKRFSINHHAGYCIEPGVAPGVNYGEAIQWEKSSLPIDVRQDIVLYAYYGLDYKNHASLLYRVATQALIWERVLGNNTKVTIYSDADRTKEVDIDDERNDILSLVEKHKKVPSFSSNTEYVEVGKDFSLTDTNEVLNEFEIESDPFNIASIKGNELKINTNKQGNFEITFIRKKYYNRDFIIFHDDDYQDLIGAGDGFLTRFKINVVAKGGKITLNKVDKDTDTNKAQGKASLKGAVYGIYDEEDKLISQLITDEFGHAESLENLDIGTYFVKEISPSEGYELDETIYRVEINSAANVEVKVKEPIKKREFTFIKILANKKTGMQMPEANVLFGIYDLEGNLIMEKRTDNEGKIEFTLPYGEYVLKQLSTTEGYEKLNDYYFKVEESGKETKVFADEIISAYLKIIKIDSKTGKNVMLAHIKFKIYDLINKKYVEQKISYPDASIIDVFETNAEGILILPEPLEKGKYRLEEVDEPILGYTWNKGKIKFTIDENSDFIYDNTYGKIIEIKFKNDPVKGVIEVYKKGKYLEYEDNELIEKVKNLANVMFGLYAATDIYDGTGTKIYNKDDLIGYYYTDKEGYFKVENLYLGKYYLKEIKNDNSYNLSNEKIDIELKYKDQYTSIVYEKVYVTNMQKQGKLKILKLDSVTKEPLSGVTFQIFNNNDELIYTGITNEFGFLELVLPIGKYYLIEKETIEGYELNMEKIYFEIKENEEVIDCTYLNNPLKVYVPDTYLTGNYDFIPALGLIGYAFKKKNSKK